MPKKRASGTEKTSVWQRPALAPNGDSPLSRERIVAAAVEMLDAGGLDGLTMRGLAERLGSGVMSLYWHVDNKDDVVDLALDAVLAYRAPEPQPEGDWRAEIVHVLDDWRTTMLRHPWSAPLLPRRVLGPSALGRLERLGQALSRAGVGAESLNVAVWALWNHVMGATITRASFSVSDGDRAAMQQHLAGLGEAYPTVAASRLLLDDDWDGAFRRGLDFLLDGLVPGSRR